MYKHYLAIIISLCIVVGCKKSNTDTYEKTPHGVVVSNVLQAKIGDSVYDGFGKKYRKVTEERVLGSGISNVEVWERYEPLDTNHWYTPTLTSKIYTNDAPGFNSLFRIDGESSPFFKP